MPEPSDAAADATVLRYLRGDFRRATAVRRPNPARPGAGWAASTACATTRWARQRSAASTARSSGPRAAHYVARHGVRPPKPLADAAAEAAAAARANPAAASADWLLFDECEQRAVPMPAAMREHMARTTTLASKENLQRPKGGGVSLNRAAATVLVALCCAWCLSHAPLLCARHGVGP